MLSDNEIRAAIDRGAIIIDPPPEDHDFQPASVDVHLGSRFGILILPFGDQPIRITDTNQVNYIEAESIAILPGAFMLGHIAERLTLSPQYVARIEGKSSLGRKGLAIHVTAGFVDPGWDGNLTIEIFNASQVTYLLKAGDTIAQLAFDRMRTPSDRPYGHPDLKSHYQGSNTVTGS